MKKILPLLAVMLMASVAYAQDTNLRVVASIKPIHSIAAALMEGVGAPDLLITGATNPHDYQIRPSDARNLQDADVLFWISPSFEGKSIGALAQSARVVTLVPDEDGHEEHGHEEHGHEEHGHDEHGHDEHEHDEHEHDEHEHDEHEHDEHGHGEENRYIHLWLDPHRVEEAVAVMAEALIQADPNHASVYRANARVLSTRLHQLDESLRESTARLEDDRSYIVFHDAYAPFEDRYGLGSTGSLLPGSAHGHEHGPSAHRLAELREILLEGNTEVACVFIEPAFNPASAHTLVEGTSVKVVTIDPLGTDIPPSPDAYFLLMENIAESFRECFATQ